MMSSNDAHMLFFPTPYPDEILYSVLCRYHLRLGNPSAVQTNRELWGKTYGKKLFLPDSIESIAAQIPQNANLTAERFISQNTIFPLLKPFLTKAKCDALAYAMRYGDSNIYNILSFSHVFTLQHRRLRFCPCCIKSDIEMFGEPYWHRTHQLSGVYICPVHNTVTIDSDAELTELHFEYFSTLSATSDTGIRYDPDTFAKLADFAHDTGWILQYGVELGFLEHTDELYNKWLRVKGYRYKSGVTNGRRLAKGIVGYYGKEFLEVLDAYNSGACTWLTRIVQSISFQHPLYHLLLIRFLAGTTKSFFEGTRKKIPEYLPYGEPPYPCRNVICEHHLKDVIEHIEVVNIKGNYRATFICPHCGFIYRRKTPLPKEKQYTGQIDIAEYGWKWKKTVANRLLSDESPYVIARSVHCDVRTIISFGIDRGLLSPERFIKRPEYVPAEFPHRRPDFAERRDQYRQRWLEAISANQGVTRSELRRLDGKADQWLHQHDAEWLEQNSPPAKNALSKWAGHDDEYLERVANAVRQIYGFPGRPKQISIAAIGRKAGIIKPHIRLTSDFLPKTKAFVAANIETLEQWQHRKILWAVQQMRERGEVITVYKVRHRASIEDPGRKLDGFIEECIMSSE